MCFKRRERRQCPHRKDTTPALEYVPKSARKEGGGYFLGSTESFIALPTRNFSVVFAGIWIVSPVAGLRPSRAFRSERTSFPKPGNTNSPLVFTSEVARFERSSKSCFTWARFIPVRSAKKLITSDWVIRFLPVAVLVAICGVPPPKSQQNEKTVGARYTTD